MTDKERAYWMPEQTRGWKDARIYHTRNYYRDNARPVDVAMRHATALFNSGLTLDDDLAYNYETE